MSRQIQDYNQLLRLVALIYYLSLLDSAFIVEGAIHNTNMGRMKQHSHACKSKYQVELTFKDLKPQFSPRMRGKK